MREINQWIGLIELLLQCNNVYGSPHGQPASQVRRRVTYLLWSKLDVLRFLPSVTLGKLVETLLPPPGENNVAGALVVAAADDSPDP